MRPKQRQQVLLRRAEAAGGEAVAGALSAESAAGDRASATPNVRTGQATNLASQPLHRRRRRARLMMRARRPSCCSRPMQPVAAARAASLPRVLSASRAVLPTARAARARAAMLRHGRAHRRSHGGGLTRQALRRVPAAGIPLDAARRGALPLRLEPLDADAQARRLSRVRGELRRLSLVPSLHCTHFLPLAAQYLILDPDPCQIHWARTMPSDRNGIIEMHLLSSEKSQ